MNFRVNTSKGLNSWLALNNVSLAFTSYQAGQLFLVGHHQDKVTMHHDNFGRAMGLAWNGSALWLASRFRLWRLENVLGENELADQLYDRVFLPRISHLTGDVDAHEVGILADGRPIFVNTRFSCLATLNATKAFTPAWRPKFISRLAGEDRCHLNGLALYEGEPLYVTVVSQSDMIESWRHNRRDGGAILNVQTGSIVRDGLSMPHSPRRRNDSVFYLNSGTGWLMKDDERVCFCPGFLRGLTFVNDYAIVTVSLPRDGVFAGLEISETLKAKGGQAWCAVLIIDLRSGDIVETIRFVEGITELFDVIALPGVRSAMSLGPESPRLDAFIRF